MVVSSNAKPERFSTVSNRASRGAFMPGIQSVIPTRTGCRPVRSEARVGEQTGEGV